MPPRRRVDFLIGILLCAFLLPASADDIITGSDNLSVDVSRVDGRIAMDLLGSIWILPAKGGQAIIAADGQQQASRPRWSPDGKKILYQIASGEGAGLWLLDKAISSIVQGNEDLGVGAFQNTTYDINGPLQLVLKVDGGPFLVG